MSNVLNKKEYVIYVNIKLVKNVINDLEVGKDDDIYQYLQDKCTIIMARIRVCAWVETLEKHYPSILLIILGHGKIDGDFCSEHL